MCSPQVQKQAVLWTTPMVETHTSLAGFRSHLSSLADVSDEAFQAFSSLLVRRVFAPRAWLLRGGDHAELCFFIERGLVRELYLGVDGAEHTRVFLAEGALTGSLLDLRSGEASVTWIQSIERTETLAWRYADFEALCQKYPTFHIVARRSAEILALRKIRREHEMLACSGAERYRRWLRDSGGIDARISRRELASYLGVTPEHLSRLRRLETSL
jgi:CRP/FNR family transcriptional regulator, anaerobic regulatory protein